MFHDVIYPKTIYDANEHENCEPKLKMKKKTEFATSLGIQISTVTCTKGMYMV